MDIRKIKLTLTVDLMNNETSSGPILFARKSMGKFKSQVGKYLGLLEKGSIKINDAIERRSFALQYEYCTLDLELVTDAKSSVQVLQGFNLTPN